MENKLTPEAILMIDTLAEAKNFSDYAKTTYYASGLAAALESSALLAAQGLYTKEQVKEYIKAAVSIGGRNPGIETDAQQVAETILPSPPKTEVWNKNK